ncbi:MAG: hypothetical protein PHX39_05525 [Bacteroidales bacterium]|nr:hypothetical protein [Bacteroidales bacterium]
MTAVELKKVLISRIADIEDESFLMALKTILDATKVSQVIMLTQEQRAEIKESKKDIEAGRFVEQSEIDNLFNQWENAQ